ncbi:MAG: hypothetical protein RLZZ488_2386 [Pseudomonadota bacterium]|jgi:hypothetical protein
MNVFRTATTQAIRDIISDHGTANRFGMSLTDADIDAICTRVVDLFEMTLNLRAQIGLAGQPQEAATQQKPSQSAMRPSRWENESASVPKSKAASELYDLSHLEGQRVRSDSLPRFAPEKDPAVELKLPRKRINVSSDEKEILMRRAQAPSVALTQTP